MHRDSDNEKIKDLNSGYVEVVTPVVNNPSFWSHIFNRAPAKAKPKPTAKPVGVFTSFVVLAC